MIWRAAGIVCFLALALGLTRHIEREGVGSRAEAHFLYLPSSKYLEITSLGHTTLLADVLYLWSIQYYGDYTGQWVKRFDYLWHIYDVITDLDSTFTDAYYMGSLVMSLDADDRDMAVRLLEKGIAHNPEEWMFLFEAAFLHYEEARYEEAAHYFGRAMAVQGSSPAVKRLHASMLAKAGRYEEAARMWEQVCLESDDRWIRNIAGRHIFEIRVKIDTLRLKKAREEYEALRGRRPPRLAELVRAGILSSLPLDPYGEPYIYDPRTGDVSCLSQYRFMTPPPPCSPLP
jgi:tetratricopeptide (TPR) repeat protein